MEYKRRPHYDMPRVDKLIQEWNTKFPFSWFKIYFIQIRLF